MKLKSNQPKASAEQVVKDCPSSNGLRQMGLFIGHLAEAMEIVYRWLHGGYITHLL